MKFAVMKFAKGKNPLQFPHYMRKLFKERKLFKGGNYMRKYGISELLNDGTLLYQGFFSIRMQYYFYQNVFKRRRAFSKIEFSQFIPNFLLIGCFSSFQTRRIRKNMERYNFRKCPSYLKNILNECANHQIHSTHKT